MEKKSSYLRQIPAVNDLLDCDFANKLREIYPRQVVVDGIRTATDNLRTKILDTDLKELENDAINIDATEILKEVEDYLEAKFSPNLSSVINATGVIVHTNLGRSLLSKSAQESIKRVSQNYSNLEIDVESGERGSRYSHIEGVLTELTGAEAALVVNNNAAAVLLTLSAIGVGKEAIISRGQLVEIGGSFRIPDVMEQSGTYLRGIGCTNKVHLKDYKEAINEKTGLILKVHTSNYKVLGFTKEVSLEELAELGRENNIPVVDDLGSGILVDLSPWGLSYERTVQDSIAAGADIVSFSGDKLLGGPQAGIIVGKEKYINQMKSHPLNRALRVDKFTLAALEATLQEYRNMEEVYKQIPTLKMITTSLETLKGQANKLATQLRDSLSKEFEIKVKKGNSQVGGGAFPLEKLPTYVIELSTDKLTIDNLAQKLRLNNPPIFTRIYNDAIIFDLRTLKEEEFIDIRRSLISIVDR